MQKPARNSRGPGVQFPPPILFAAGFLVGWLLDRRLIRLPLLRAGEPGAAWLEFAGWGLCLAGLALGAWGMFTFARAHTAIFPNQPAARLVLGGPYRFTRNPMYLGLTSVFLGLTGLSNSVWPLVMLPLVIAALHFLVIRREERYLSSAFTEEYAAYRRRVRRWI